MRSETWSSASVSSSTRTLSRTSRASGATVAVSGASPKQGESVDRSKMLRLAQVCGLPANGLRDVLFDLPHAGGSQRRRAERSPLSERETAVLHVLAQGKVYKVIALELGLAVSTVRTHLHNTYRKLGVDDRAQAVLRATEMGWL